MIKKLQEQPNNHGETSIYTAKQDTHLPSLLISKNEVYPMMQIF